MNNKVLVELNIPVLEEKYDVYIPINRKVGDVINLISKIVNELSGGYFIISKTNALYSGEDGTMYEMNKLVYNTNIRNGTKLILM